MMFPERLSPLDAVGISEEQLWKWVVERDRARVWHRRRLLAPGELKERLSGRMIEAGNPYALPPDIGVSIDEASAFIEIGTRVSAMSCFEVSSRQTSGRAPDRAVAGTIDNAEFYHLALQQPQGPACASLGRLGTGQGNQLGLFLAVKKSEQSQASRAACGSTRPRSLLPPVVCAPGKPSMG